MTGVSLFKKVREGKPSLGVSWTAPQSNLTISRYLVQLRRSGSTVWGTQVGITGSPPATATLLPALDASTEYDIRVRAVSAAGVGEWSEVQTIRTFSSEHIHILSMICCCKGQLHLWQIYTYSIISSVYVYMYYHHHHTVQVTILRPIATIINTTNITNTTAQATMRAFSISATALGKRPPPPPSHSA